MGECAGSRSMGRQWERWIDTGKECLKEIGLMSGKQGKWCMIGVYWWGL